MNCAAVTINFGAAFFWVLTILCSACCFYAGLMIGSGRRQYINEVEIQRRVAWINAHPHIALDKRPAIQRVDPSKLLRLKYREPDPEKPREPEGEGWRRLEFQVAAE